MHIFDLGFVEERLIREDIYQQGRQRESDETNAAFQRRREGDIRVKRRLYTQNGLLNVSDLSEDKLGVLAVHIYGVTGCFEVMVKPINP